MPAVIGNDIGLGTILPRKQGTMRLMVVPSHWRRALQTRSHSAAKATRRRPFAFHSTIRRNTYAYRGGDDVASSLLYDTPRGFNPGGFLMSHPTGERLPQRTWPVRFRMDAAAVMVAINTAAAANQSCDRIRRDEPPDLRTIRCCSFIFTMPSGSRERRIDSRT